jgi:hypothetical protein
MAYKAPPNNQGYDLICIHPDPKINSDIIRIQVKSRYATDSNKTVLLKSKSFEAFDYLMVVYLNVGHFYSSTSSENDFFPEFYTIPIEIVQRFHNPTGWQKIETCKIESLTDYKDELGFELIANKLGIPKLKRENY